MIDSHCHLHLCKEPFEEILLRAEEGGLQALVQVATDVATAERSLALSEAAKPSACRVFPTAGLYPTNAKHEHWRDELQKLDELLSTGSYVAVGEMGIDMFHDQSYLAPQQEMFAEQLKLSLKYQLPCILHIRNSYDEVSEVLESFKGEPLRGVWHCFEGSLDQAQAFVERGWYISFSGLLTYKNNESLRDVARELPLDRLLIETDSPYLSPVPWRRERNEPWKVVSVLKTLAELHGKSESALELQVDANTRDLFELEL